MNPIQNNPLQLRLAQAYGLRPVQPVRAVAPASGGVRAGGSGDFRSIGAARGADSVELSSNVAARERIAGLVAARVPGSIDFTLTNEGVLTPGEAGALKLHLHPADLNAAATGVALGQKFDLEA